VIIDEGSMIDATVGRDLLSFGKKALVCGDLAQLPPVGGGGFFSSGEPDFVLTEVHRQARESGILDLATFVREGGEPFDWRRGRNDCEVWSRSDVAGQDIWRRMISADQVIVGTNRTRHSFNEKHRRMIGLGSESKLPVPGDKVVCLRNDRDLGLLNGSMWRVDAAKASRDQATVTMELTSEEGVQLTEPVRAWSHHFLGREGEIPDLRRRQHQEFDFGYHVTCHKAQGDQWPDVVVFDESGRFDRETARRWVYTAITRASERLLFIV
jgi:exodeoxyribonuclease-5